MFRFIESIRIENYKVHLADLHQARIDKTLAYYRAKSVLQVKKLAQKIDIPSSSIYKWRIVYDLDGHYITELQEYYLPFIKTFRLVEAGEMDYQFKFEDREAFNRLKSNRKNEEIIILKRGEVTDTSFSNLIFRRGDQWYTPSGYLLNGVMRKYLLNTGITSEMDINTGNIMEFESLQLINAMRPFGTEIFSINTIR